MRKSPRKEIVLSILNASTIQNYLNSAENSFSTPFKSKEIPFRYMNIRNDATTLIFFAYRAGRPMTEDRSGAIARVSPNSLLIFSFTGRKADIQIS